MAGGTGARRVARTPGRPTPIVIAPWVRTVLVVGCALGLGLFFYAATSTLVILIGGFFVALVLSFPVNALTRFMPRGAAILATALLVLAIVALALLFAVPLLLAQLTELVRAIPGFAAASAERAGQWLATLEARGLLPADTDTVIAGAQTALFARAGQLAEDLLGQLTGAIFGSFFATLILTSTTLVIALYFLVDVRGVKVTFLRLPPRRYRRDADALWDTIARTYRRWLGALLLSMLFEAVVASLGLWALGIPFALLLGIWMGLTAAIPYVGAWLGAIPGVFLALLDSPRTALLAAGALRADQRHRRQPHRPAAPGQRGRRAAGGGDHRGDRRRADLRRARRVHGGAHAGPPQDRHRLPARAVAGPPRREPGAHGGCPTAAERPVATDYQPPGD